MTFPVKLYHPDADPRKKPISARNHTELEALQRIGWKVKE